MRSDNFIINLKRQSLPLELWPFKSFKPAEFACAHCGEFYYDYDFYQRLQIARELAQQPFNINSGHRCELHNAAIGGAPLSSHLKIAADIHVTDLTRNEIYGALKEAGFTSFGRYKNFIHVDPRANKNWFGKGARKKWLRNF